MASIDVQGPVSSGGQFELVLVGEPNERYELSVEWSDGTTAYFNVGTDHAGRTIERIEAGPAGTAKASARPYLRDVPVLVENETGKMVDRGTWEPSFGRSVASAKVEVA